MRNKGQILKWLIIGALSILIMTFLWYNKNLDKFYQWDDRRPYSSIFSLIEKWSVELSNWKNDELIDFEWLKFIPSFENIDNLNRWYDNVLEYQNPRFALYIWVSEYLVVDDFFYISRVFFLIALTIVIWVFIRYLDYNRNQAALYYWLAITIVLLSSVTLMRSNLLINNLYAILFLFASLICFFVYEKKWLWLFFLIILFLNRQEYALFFLFWLFIYLCLKSRRLIAWLMIWISLFIIWTYLINFHQPLYDYIINADEWMQKMILQMLWYIFDIRSFSIFTWNSKNYFTNIFPLYGVILPVIMIVVSEVKWSNRSKLLLSLILTSVFIFYYFLKNQDFQWYDTGWILWSYSRYILFVYIIASILLIKLVSSLKWKQKIFPLFLLIIFWFISSTSSLAKMQNFISQQEWVKLSLNTLWMIEKNTAGSSPLLIDATDWCYFWMDLHNFDAICIEDDFQAWNYLKLLDLMTNDDWYGSIYFTESREWWYRKWEHNIKDIMVRSWFELKQIDVSKWGFNRPILYKMTP